MICRVQDGNIKPAYIVSVSVAPSAPHSVQHQGPSLVKKDKPLTRIAQIHFEWHRTAR